MFCGLAAEQDKRHCPAAENQEKLQKQALAAENGALTIAAAPVRCVYLFHE